MASAAAPTEVSSRERILAVARAEFAAHGFDGARLQDIAGGAGLRHPTLLYYFASKEGLYAAVIAQAVADWAEEMRLAIENPLTGFAQVSALVEAGYRFCAEHEDFVRIVRRETIEGGGRLEGAIAEVVRPLLERAIAFLERETAAGRLLPHDPLEVMQLVYGAVLTSFSDARFRSKLTGEEPLEVSSLVRQRDALLALLRPALEPTA